MNDKNATIGWAVMLRIGGTVKFLMVCVIVLLLGGSGKEEGMTTDQEEKEKAATAQLRVA